MTTWPRRFGSALLSLSLSAVVFAQTPALDVQMGLWEMTAAIDLGGQIPGIDTSTMTAAQKAQVEAMMKKSLTPKTTVSKSCLTRENFERSPMMTMQQEGTTCKQTYTTNTRRALAGTFSCTGTMTMNGQMRVDAPSPTAFTADMTNTTTQSGQTMTVKIAMTGKWLGADCGGVK